MTVDITRDLYPSMKTAVGYPKGSRCFGFREYYTSPQPPKPLSLSDRLQSYKASPLKIYGRLMENGELRIEN
jgi:hypothetical protein